MPSPPPTTTRPHPLSATLHRHWLLLFSIFCLVCSLVNLIVPSLHRRYELSGSLPISIPNFPPLPDLARLPQSTLAELPASDVRITLHDTSVQFSAGNATYNAAWVQLHRASDQFTTMLNHRIEEALASYQTSLQTTAQRLAAREQATSKDIEAYRLSHRGMLPDDPNSVIAQFEKISTKLDDQHERLQLLKGQIARLQSLKTATPLTPALTPSPDKPAPPPPQSADQDPEVMTLKAQLQLINDQLTEQFQTMHRTEQHPYVVELRSRQSELQKKLEAAKERAVAGRPPPPEVIAAVGSTAGKSSSDLQLEILQADQGTLEAEVKTLNAQRNQLQKKVDELLPIRQEFSKLNDQLAAVRKERETNKAAMEEYARRFPPASSMSDVPELTMTSGGTLPVFPRLTTTYLAALILAAGAAAICAVLLHRKDQSLHSSQDVATTLDLPILGAISEIHSPAQRHRLHQWHAIGRPSVIAACLVLAVGSAGLCYRRLSNPSIASAIKQGAGSIFIADKSGE